MTTMRSTLLVALVFTLSGQVGGDVFTAVTELGDVLLTDARLIVAVDRFIKLEEARFVQLKHKVQMYKQEHAKALHDVVEYLSNPVNAFLLIKRLTRDWNEIEELLIGDVEILQTVEDMKRQSKFPEEQDLQGAAVALTRLQDVYRLDTSDISRGVLNGVHYGALLTADDCFEIGNQVQLAGDHFSAILWMREALSRTDKAVTKSVLNEQILRKLSVALHHEGYVRTSLALTNDLLQIRPRDINATSNKILLEHELKSKGTTLKTDDGLPLHEIRFAEARHLGDELREKYKSLCRGEVDRSPKREAGLKCRLVVRNSAFLRLAPLKLEEVHHNPDIVIYHDVMSDSEIRTVRQLAKPRFQRAVVFHNGTNQRVTADYRISKSGWLKDHEHKHILDISRRVEDMTGLTVATAEELQVVNYGVGGHYEPHFDFLRANEQADWSKLLGNRVATVLFYMSDVAQGGATVFTKLNVGAWPKKGSAVFWHNLHASGERDFRTLHAGCPVLVGSKWVCNKWQHVIGQEFRRPCPLAPDYPLDAVGNSI